MLRAIKHVPILKWKSLTHECLALVQRCTQNIYKRSELTWCFSTRCMETVNSVKFNKGFILFLVKYLIHRSRSTRRALIPNTNALGVTWTSWSSVKADKLTNIAKRPINSGMSPYAMRSALSTWKFEKSNFQTIWYKNITSYQADIFCSG